MGVIIYIDEQVAQSMCVDPKWEDCKGVGDTSYTVPIKKWDEDKWFVQILNKDVRKLTSEEFDSLGAVPAGWFDPNI